MELKATTGLKRPGRLGWGQKLGPLFGLLVIVVVVTALEPGFLSLNNIFNVLRQVSINALIAFGMTFVILTGGIDLSVGSILALASALVAGMMVDGQHAVMAVALGLIAGAVLGVQRGGHHIRKSGAVHRNIGYDDHLSRLDARLYGRKTDYRSREFRLV